MQKSLRHHFCQRICDLHVLTVDFADINTFLLLIVQISPFFAAKNPAAQPGSSSNSPSTSDLAQVSQNGLSDSSRSSPSSSFNPAKGNHRNEIVIFMLLNEVNFPESLIYSR